MLWHMSDIILIFFEDLPTDLPTDRPTFPVLYASLLRRSIKTVRLVTSANYIIVSWKFSLVYISTQSPPYHLLNICLAR